jgi:hypothetical protein
MPITELLKNDPLVVSNFYLEIDGAEIATLTEVSGVEADRQDGSAPGHEVAWPGQAAG